MKTYHSFSLILISAFLITCSDIKEKNYLTYQDIVKDNGFKRVGSYIRT